MVFHTDKSDSGIKTKHWSLTYQLDARTSFGISALSCTVFDTMIATCWPGWDLSCFCCIMEQFEDMEFFFSPPFHTTFPTPQLAHSNNVWCEINHAIIDLRHSYYCRKAIATVIHSTSAILHEILFASREQSRKRFNRIVPTSCIPLDPKWCRKSNIVNQLSKNTL